MKTGVKQDHRRALLLMLAASLLWPAIEHTEVSLMGRHHALQVTFLRYVAHLVVLTAVVLPFTGVKSLRTERPLLQLLRGLLMFCMPVCFILGREYASAGWVWSMFWTMPAVAIVAAAVLLRERPHLAGAAASLAGAAGAVAIMGGDGSVIGSMFGIGMGATVAGYMVLTRVLRDESLPASLLYTAIGAVTPTALLVWRVWTPILASELATIAVVGAISVLIIGAFALSLEAGPVFIAVPVLSLVPVWEATLAVPVRHALPGIRQLAGIAVICIGIAMLVSFRMSNLVPRSRTEELS